MQAANAKGCLQSIGKSGLGKTVQKLSKHQDVQISQAAQALCTIDALRLEWHTRLWRKDRALLAARQLNLSRAGEVGGGMMWAFTEAIRRTVREGLRPGADCATELLEGCEALVTALQASRRLELTPDEFDEVRSHADEPSMHMLMSP